MIEKQFGAEYGPPLQRGDKTACIVNLHAEIDARGGVPYGWLKIYEVLLFAFYNPRTGQCFPLKLAREHHLIVWAHGLVRNGWQVLRTSNRYAFAAFLSIRRIAASITASNGQKRRGIPTSYKSFAETAAEAKMFRFPPAPSTV